MSTHSLDSLVKGLDAQKNGSSWLALCPAHGDKTPSLGINEGDDGKPLVHCHAGCTQENVVAALRVRGLWPEEESSPVAEGIPSKWYGKPYHLDWVYRSTCGDVLGYVVRYEDAKGKEIIPFFKPNGTGWKPGAAPVPRPLYGLNLLAQKPDAPVIVTEGEKAADAAQRLLPGYVVVTSPGGSKAAGKADWTPLKGRTVIIFPDNDEPGQQYAEDVAQKLLKVGVMVQGIIDVQALVLPEKGDAADWPVGKPLPDPLPMVREATASNRTASCGIPMPAVMTARELQRKEFPEPRWLVPEILPEGTDLLGGKPKVGKSFAATDLALGIACGGYVFGKVKVEPAGVLYLCLEDQDRRLQSRIRNLFNGNSWPEALHLATSWPRIDQGGLPKLQEWLDRHRDVRLVIIDTLAKIKPRSALRDKALYDADYQLVDSIKTVAESTGTSILIVHHLRKMEGQDPFDCFSGSTGLTGVVDTGLVLTREKGQGRLYIRGRDVEEKTLALQQGPQGGWTLLGEAAEVQATKEQQEAYDSLKRLGGRARLKEVAAAIGKKGNAVSYLLKRLADKGTIQHDGYGMYIIPESTGSPVCIESPESSRNIQDSELGSAAPESLNVYPMGVCEEDSNFQYFQDISQSEEPPIEFPPNECLEYFDADEEVF